MTDYRTLLDNIPQWVLITIPILAALFALYLISRLFESDKVRDRGIFGILTDWLESSLIALTDELIDFAAFLFGRSKDIKGDSVNEVYFHKLTKPAIAIASILVIVSFVGSFNASRDFAANNGIGPGVAFGIPIAVDGLILLSVLAILAFSFVGENVIWLKIILLAATLVSVVFNVSHIETGNTALTASQWTLGAVFPVVVFVGTEILSLQFKRRAIRQHLVKTNDELEQQAEQARKELDALATKIADLRKRQADMESAIRQTESTSQEAKKAEPLTRSAPATTGIDTKEAAYQFMINAHKEGYEPTGAEVAQQIDRSDSLGRKLKRELWPGIAGNGNGNDTGNGAVD